MSNIDGIIDTIVKKLGLQKEGYIEMGGKGSGNWGHKGRKGKRGGSLPSKGKSGVTRQGATRPSGAKLNKEWITNFGESHGEKAGGPFENVIGESNPHYYTARVKGKLVAGATTTREGLITFIHSIGSHAVGKGEEILNQVKKDSIFIRTLAATEQGKKFFARNGFIYDPHPGQYNYRWAKRSK